MRSKLLLVGVSVLTVLMQVILPVQVAQAAVSVRVAASADDFGAYWNGAAWVGGTGTTSVIAGYVSAAQYKWGSGMRFLNITVPNGAIITTAYLTFQSNSNRSNNNVNSIIIGEDVDDAATFSTLADYQARRGTIIGGANNNYITAANVTWNSIGSWSLDSTYNSPSITTIVQEIVNRAGWSSGNDMALFWDDFNDLSTHGADTFRASYSYDGSAAKAPVLYIEYATVPTVTTSAASGITYSVSHRGTLNGAITATGGVNSDMRGFVWSTASNVTNPGNNQPPATYTDNWTEVGSFGVAAFTHEITGLIADTTYYFRAYAHNSVGWAYGDQQSFLTLTTPTISSVAASVVATTTARLNALVTEDGNQAADVRFLYGKPAGNYTDSTAWVDNTYTTGQTPFADIAGLTAGQTYYFIAQIKNDFTTQNSTALSFTTESGISAPSNLQGVATAASITLNWSKGTGSTNTLVRAKLGAYPTTTADGTLLYLNTDTSVIHSGLSAGTTYFYRAWGESSGTYSTGSAYLIMTTSAGTVVNNTLNPPPQPSGWLVPPDATKAQNLPFYDFLNWGMDAFSLPHGTGWFLWTMFFAIATGVFIYSKNQNIVVGSSASIIVMGIGWMIGIVSGFLVIAYVIFAVAVMIVGSRL